MSSTIKIRKVQQSRINEIDFNNLPFGKNFSDHMFIADYSNGAWHDFRIVPYEHILLSPAVSGLHYGQSIFEGLKAHYGVHGNPMIFRPEMNAKRLNISAERMAMPKFPEDIFLEALRELIQLDSAWVPKIEGGSLYIRPFMFANDEYVGIRVAENYKFIIFCSPVGKYYSDDVKVFVGDNYVRAFKGGTGFAKAAGNYGASMYPSKLVREKGYDQILWTDGVEHKYIHEIGTMNVFFQIGDKILTPNTDEGTILKGITRDSVLTLLNDWEIDVEIRPITIDEIISAFKNNTIKAAFGAGTAATIAPISTIHYQGIDYVIPKENRSPLLDKIASEIDGIKHGTKSDKHGWILEVENAEIR